ncbi:hypothetical protein H6G76_04325 [Nostoc sp. FACHB-152]|uniref:hypothetical protein n=1 Tax=unclassified Nostoc TaxID=2593658 RepID=UPI0016864CEA|nr:MULTISPECIES: hypothetical protein [unclassified Nostoc]MBD2446398.1 hypothetical protein [Nostoc sp. FACHB-152]MBD2469647.1 hypothetical protein [Nostoc sp. FACHB-145]
MQFAIECNTLKKQQMCLICHHPFQMGAARLVVCSNQGDSYGDVCPECISRGGSWIGSQLRQIQDAMIPN